MASASLSAEVRNDRGKGVARKLRAAGRVPGVVYGDGREPQSLSLVARDLDNLLSHIAAASPVIALTPVKPPTKTPTRETQRLPPYTPATPELIWKPKEDEELAR